MERMDAASYGAAPMRAAPYLSAPEIGGAMVGSLSGMNTLGHKVPPLLVAMMNPAVCAVKLPDLRCLPTQLNKFDGTTTLTVTTANNTPITAGDVLMSSFCDNEPHMLVMTPNPGNNVLYVCDAATPGLATCVVTNNDTSKLYTRQRTITQSYAASITTYAALGPLNGTVVTGYVSDLNDVQAFANGTYENVSVTRKDAHPLINLQDGAMFIGGPEQFKPDYTTPAFFRTNAINGSVAYSVNFNETNAGVVAPGGSYAFDTLAVGVDFRRHLFKKGFKVKLTTSVNLSEDSPSQVELRTNWTNGVDPVSRFPRAENQSDFIQFSGGENYWQGDYTNDLLGDTSVPQKLFTGYQSLLGVTVIMSNQSTAPWPIGSAQYTLTLEEWSETPTQVFGPYGLATIQGITENMSMNLLMNWALEGLPSGQALQVQPGSARPFVPASVDEIVLVEAIFNEPTSIIQRTMDGRAFFGILADMAAGKINYPFVQGHQAITVPVGSASAYGSSPLGDTLAGLASGLLGKIPIIGPLLSPIAGTIMRGIGGASPYGASAYGASRMGCSPLEHKVSDEIQPKRPRYACAPSELDEFYRLAPKMVGQVSGYAAAPMPFDLAPLTFAIDPKSHRPSLADRISTDAFKGSADIKNGSIPLHRVMVGLQAPGEGWSRFVMVNMDDPTSDAGLVAELCLSKTPLFWESKGASRTPGYHTISMSATSKFYLDERFDEVNLDQYIQEAANVMKLLGLKDYYVTLLVDEDVFGDSFALSLYMAAYNLHVGFAATGGIEYTNGEILIKPVSHIQEKYVAASKQQLTLLAPITEETTRYRLKMSMSDCANVQDILNAGLSSTPTMIIVRDAVQAVVAAEYVALTRKPKAYTPEEVLADQDLRNKNMTEQAMILAERSNDAFYNSSTESGKLVKTPKTPEQIEVINSQLETVPLYAGSKNSREVTAPLHDIDWWRKYESVITSPPPRGLNTTLAHILGLNKGGTMGGLIYEGKTKELINLATQLLQRVDPMVKTTKAQPMNRRLATFERARKFFQPSTSATTAPATSSEASMVETAPMDFDTEVEREVKRRMEMRKVQSGKKLRPS
jgi:hypothetical protein